jgi:hypothetical protein
LECLFYSLKKVRGLSQYLKNNYKTKRIMEEEKKLSLSKEITFEGKPFLLLFQEFSTTNDISIMENLGFRKWRQIFTKEQLEKFDPGWNLFQNSHQIANFLYKNFKENDYGISLQSEVLELEFNFNYNILDNIRCSKLLKLHINKDESQSTEEKIENVVKQIRIIQEEKNTNEFENKLYKDNIEKTLHNLVEEISNIKNEIKLMKKKRGRPIKTEIKKESDIKEEESESKKTVKKQRIYGGYSPYINLTRIEKAINLDSIKNKIKICERQFLEIGNDFIISPNQITIQKNIEDGKNSIIKISGAIAEKGISSFKIRIDNINIKNKYIYEICLGFRNFEQSVEKNDQSWAICLTKRKNYKLEKTNLDKKIFFQLNDVFEFIINMNKQIIILLKNGSIMLCAEFNIPKNERKTLYPFIGLASKGDTVTLVNI